MLGQQKLLVNSGSDFEKIYDLLMRSPNERERFLVDPKKVLNEMGLKVRQKTLKTLEKIVSISIDKDKAGFNEKLVLCSSSGY